MGEAKYHEYLLLFCVFWGVYFDIESFGKID